MQKKEVLRTIKFTLFSISAGIIQIGVNALLFEVFKVDHQISYLVGLVLSVLYNFTVNRKFTFKAANNVPIAMLKVALFYVVFTPFSFWLEGILATVIYPLLATLVLMILNFVLEYLYCTFFVYRNAIDSAEKK